MPDLYGFPNVDECRALIDITAADDPPAAAVIERIPSVIRAVIAEFESPLLPKGKGGTGRSFHPFEETRYFDGNGLSELLVHDLVPTETIAVVVNDVVTLADIGVRQAHPFQPSNVLYRKQNAAALTPALGFPYVAGDPHVITPLPYPMRTFPLGLQNIAITATWGNAVTADIYEAIKGEVANRVLIESSVGLDGVGEEIEIGNFHVNTGQTAFASPLTMFHSQYELTKQTYRRKVPRRFVRSQSRMI